MPFKIFFALFCLWSHCVNGLPLEIETANIEDYFTPLIVGGSDAPEAYAPHMAALVAGEMFTMLACGGSIVLPNLILTAAHCIEAFVVPGGLLQSFHAVVGANNWKTGGTAVLFKDYHIHPKWDYDLIKNDIGFLVLEQKLTMSESVKLVPLNFDWVGGEEASFVTGWGRLSTWGMAPFHLQLLDVYTLSPRRCSDEVQEAGSWWGGPPPPHVDPAIEICSFNSVGKGLCNGDSGSALVSRRTGTQIGIASWAFQCALGAPDMYARISGFKDYIQDIMKKYQ